MVHRSRSSWNGIFIPKCHSVTISAFLFHAELKFCCRFFSILSCVPFHVYGSGMSDVDTMIRTWIHNINYRISSVLNGEHIDMKKVNVTPIKKPIISPLPTKSRSKRNASHAAEIWQQSHHWTLIFTMRICTAPRFGSAVLTPSIKEPSRKNRFQIRNRWERTSSWRNRVKAVPEPRARCHYSLSSLNEFPSKPRCNWRTC